MLNDEELRKAAVEYASRVFTRVLEDAFVAGQESAGAELKLARERLGPAGYRILSRVAKLENVVNTARKAENHWHLLQTDADKCALCIALNELENT